MIDFGKHQEHLRGNTFYQDCYDCLIEQHQEHMNSDTFHLDCESCIRDVKNMLTDKNEIVLKIDRVKIEAPLTRSQHGAIVRDN